MQNLAANLKQPNLRAKILKDKSKSLQALDDYDMNNNTVTGRGHSSAKAGKKFNPRAADSQQTSANWGPD